MITPPATVHYSFDALQYPEKLLSVSAGQQEQGQPHQRERFLIWMQTFGSKHDTLYPI